MANEEKIRSELVSKFGFADDAVRIARERRMYVTVPYARFREVLAHVCAKMGFTILATITGQDEGAEFTCLYHMARMDGTMLNIKTGVPREKPAIKTVTDLYANAPIYERELVDLLGFTVEGLPAGQRYPLPDDWPEGQYPLRKDWTTAMLKK